MFVLAHPRLPSLPRARAKGAYFAKGPNRLPSGSLDPLPPQNRSPRPRGLPIPNVSTGKPSGVRTASYPHPNHIVVKSDELTIMESHSCTKPRGVGVQKRASTSHPLATHSGPLDSYIFALLNPASRSQSTLPRHHESVSKQRTLTSLKSTLTSSHASHSKQRTLSPFRMNTYTISRCNSSRMNTSKKGVGGGGGC
jgi:hypothetical protein